jgi:hypothetical protein
MQLAIAVIGVKRGIMVSAKFDRDDPIPLPRFQIKRGGNLNPFSIHVQFWKTVVREYGGFQHLRDVFREEMILDNGKTKPRWNSNRSIRWFW